METVKLNTGAGIPAIGFGTWELKPDATEIGVKTAIQTGYRLIDTAKIYGNEDVVGRVVQDSGIPREDLFVTTKLWNDDQGFESAFKALDVSLAKLGLDYVDLYLIHWPATRRRHDAWRAFEEMQQTGKAKNIGVSNFTVDHLEQLLMQNKVTPSVNQVEFHPYIYAQQKELLDYCKSKDIVVEAYSPLARVSHETPQLVTDIAAKYGKTEQQVFLRWCIQHGTVPLPRSRNPEHIKSNFDVFGFVLGEDDMNQLNSISDGERVTWDPAGMGS